MRKNFFTSTQEVITSDVFLHLSRGRQDEPSLSQLRSTLTNLDRAGAFVEVRMIDALRAAVQGTLHCDRGNEAAQIVAEELHARLFPKSETRTNVPHTGVFPASEEPIGESTLVN